jgi:hypothetical protein
MLYKRSSPQQVARVEQQLKNLEVFSVSTVKLLRTVRDGSGEDEIIHHGRDADGRAVLRENSAGLEIFLKDADILSGQMSYVLIQRLGEHCGFDDGGMKLFTLIMNMNDPAEIEEMLDTQGIPCTSQGTSLTKQPRTVDQDESVPDDAFEVALDEIQATVRHGIQNAPSHIFEPGMEHVTSQPSPPSASRTTAGVRRLHSSQLISNFAASPRVERKLLSVQNFANALTAEDLTLTFPNRHTWQDEQDTTFQAESHDSIPVTFGQSSERRSLGLSSESSRSRTPSPAFVRREALASLGTPTPRSGNLAQQSYDNFDLSGLREALPFTTARSSQSPSLVASRAASTSIDSIVGRPGSNQWLQQGQSHVRLSSEKHLNNLIGIAGQRTQSEQDSHYEIGLYGEMSVSQERLLFASFQLNVLKVFLFLEEYLSPSFAEENWTSNYRSRALDSRFSGMEKDYADFTFRDTSEGKLAEYLCSCGFADAENWKQHRPTYHLEVKTTTGSRDDIFFMSNNQVNKARRYTLKTAVIPNDIYIVIRVFDLNVETRKGRMHFYLDPWRLSLEGKLNLEARDCFAVTPAR